MLTESGSDESLITIRKCSVGSLQTGPGYCTDRLCNHKFPGCHAVRAWQRMKMAAMINIEMCLSDAAVDGGP